LRAIGSPSAGPLPIFTWERKSNDRLGFDGGVNGREPGKRGQVPRTDKVWRGGATRIVASGLSLAPAALVALLGAPPATADPPAPPPVAVAAPAPLGPATLTPFTGNVEIEDRLDPAARLQLAAEPLDQHLPRRFYLAHHYEMVWNRHPQQAAQLWDAVRHAGDQGLDPALFHSTSLTRHWTTLSPVERDLLLSDAVSVLSRSAGAGRRAGRGSQRQ
jgi:Scaffold domain